MLFRLKREKGNLFFLPFYAWDVFCCVTFWAPRLWDCVSSLFAFTPALASQPSGQGRLSRASWCFTPLSGSPVTALAGSQPAGREPCGMQSFRNGNNHFSKPSVQNSHYVASDSDFLTCYSFAGFARMAWMFLVLLILFCFVLLCFVLYPNIQLLCTCRFYCTLGSSLQNLWLPMIVLYVPRPLLFLLATYVSMCNMFPCKDKAHISSTHAPESVLGCEEKQKLKCLSPLDHQTIWLLISSLKSCSTARNHLAMWYRTFWCCGQSQSCASHCRKMSDPFIGEWLEIKSRPPELTDEANGIAWKLLLHGRLLKFRGEPMVVWQGYN